jgi:hypothetical protein
MSADNATDNATDNAKDHPDTVAILAGLAAGLSSAEIKIVDLTHRLDPDFPNHCPAT